MNPLIKKILLGLLGVLVVMQIFQSNKTNPPADSKKDFLVVNNAPTDIAKLFKAACYDCHSNETKYPWYTYVQPVGYWINGHIKGARQSLNYSDWTTFSGNKKATAIEETIEYIEKRWMPLGSYANLHPEAKLSDGDIEKLTSWLKGLQ